MRTMEGTPLPLGAVKKEHTINFSVAVPTGEECRLLLYQKGAAEPTRVLEMKEETAVGEVRYLAVEDMEDTFCEYNYRIGEKIVVDPYARAVSGREEWNAKQDPQKHEVRSRVLTDVYDWEGDRPLNIPVHQVIAYSLHVRGFTMHNSSGVKSKGTFQGLAEKIPYLLELGINQVHCMPVYEFEECRTYTNYWGYGSAFYFAPKSAYAGDGNGVKGLKDMVKAFHRAGIEVVLEMPFTGETPKQMIEECLRYYRMEYHIDGFILNPLAAPMDAVLTDPILNSTKILRHQTEFQNVMRQFLKGDEGMVRTVIYWLRHCSGPEGTYNYIANHNGFTLNDLVSYDGKHNEINGENNLDGPDYNYSWNCGAEGPSRKKSVMALREGQRKNAFFLLLLAQGTPCILAGDEFGNTQKGNNNVYCQDNPTGWLDWRKCNKEKELLKFVKELIAFRKAHSVFWPKEELRGLDQTSCGVPDVSYHGEYAWQTPEEVSSRMVGVFYCGQTVNEEDCYVAYNMHWLPHSFALPALRKERKWYCAATTDTGLLTEPILLKNQREAVLAERTIMVFLGR